ncbi:methyltransferase [Amycolatopsis sp. WGS_07]|uniref:methyltransferase n=1 Tax=Amycolatopsis sp. WGS_07 TaxID=3076764 RepID=UPI003873B578
MTAHTTVDAQAIARLNMLFTQSKILHSGVELGVFELLAAAPRTADEIRAELGLHERFTGDFLNALAALGLLERDGEKFSNAPATAEVLVPGAPGGGYLGARVRTTAQRHYAMWGRLSEALRDGEPKADIGGHGAFAKLYEDPVRAKAFLVHMDANNALVAPQLAEHVDWSSYKSFVDVGGARGNVAAQLCLAHPHLHGGVFELPPIEPHFDELMAELGVADRVTFHAGDFFETPLPETDVVVFGHVLHDWDPQRRVELLQRAKNAIPSGGAVVVYDQILDAENPDLRSLIGSINVGLITDGGSEYTVPQLRKWLDEAGLEFRAATTLPRGNDTVVVAVKP